eukprot:TRINITY_DN1885_c0_g3_i5.p1 TRINITY_DN1885_c0_g3~~TRINITY_DN1885_c0_g3_i5.p1  ORF type:complete len:223 (+),score=17.60 TRINITY_DN1885_c0_g3_i5:58-669(+)
MSSAFDIIQQCSACNALKEILFWRDIRISGIVWSVANFILFFIVIGQYSILTLSAYLLLLGVVLGEILVLYQNSLRRNSFHGVRVSDYALSPEMTRSALDTTNKLISLFCTELFTALVTQDKSFLIRITIELLITYTVGKYFDVDVLLWLVLNVLFLCPRFYEEKKAEIDNVLDLVKKTITKYTSTLISKLPPTTQKYFGKCG